MIDTEAKLSAFLPQIRQTTWVAVDTEADSLHNYPEKVCLIQISTAGGDELVDPLAGVALDPLLEALSGHELVFHAADYDLRMLLKHHQFVPRAIFDTMLAARLLGERQFGYSHLVEKFLGVRLEKGPQKANWALRPLTLRMEEYARNDTRYLKPLSDQLKARLATAGRLAWHQESCVRLIADCTQPRPDDGDVVWRVKGSHALGRAGLAVLRSLWRWREAEAVAANRPPFFVLSHDLLVSLAAAAQSQEPIEPLLPRHLSDRRRSGIRAALADGLRTPAGAHPHPLKHTSYWPSEAERRRQAELQKHRDARSAELNLDPTIIASRATLAELAQDWEAHAPRLMLWQREVLQGA